MKGFRFQKRIKILPGTTLNLSKSGISVSAGVRGARVNFGRQSRRKTTFGMPGTGISFRAVGNQGAGNNSTTRRSAWWLIAMGALLISAAVYAQDEQGIKFKGVSLGSSATEFQAVMPESKCTATSCIFFDTECQTKGLQAMAPCLSRNSWGPVNAKSVMSSFDDGKLARVSVAFQSGSFQILRAAIVTRYGQPTSEKTSEIQTRVGMKLQSTSARWEKDGDVLTVDQYGSTINSGYAVLQSIARERQQREKTKERTQEAAKNL